jgi:hypothetical protein
MSGTTQRASGQIHSRRPIAVFARRTSRWGFEAILGLSCLKGIAMRHFASLVDPDERSPSLFFAASSERREPRRSIEPHDGHS